MKFTGDFYAQAQQCLESVVRPYRRQILAAHGDVSTEYKADTTPVTALDTELEHMMRNALSRFDSSIGFIGEELGSSGNADTFWLVDPIDGTESFIRGLPSVRNMATLIDGGQPVFTFVYKPITDELFIASEGGGAFKNGELIHSSQRPLDRCWMEFAGRLQEPDVYRVFQAARGLVGGVSISHDFTAVAEGKVDCHLIYKHGAADWDYAPRALLISEAGAKVTNIGSDKYDYKNSDTLMANRAIFDELMQTIVAAAGKN